MRTFSRHILASGADLDLNIFYSCQNTVKDGSEHNIQTFIFLLVRLSKAAIRSPNLAASDVARCH